MKIYDFELIETIERKYEGDIYIAQVKVDTGWLLWKKTKTLKVTRTYGGPWFFIETGKFTYGFVVEELARSWSAKNGYKDV